MQSTLVFATLLMVGFSKVAAQDCLAALQFIQVNCVNEIVPDVTCGETCIVKYAEVEAACSTEEQSTTLNVTTYCQNAPCFAAGEQLGQFCYSDSDEPSCTVQCTQAAEAVLGSCEDALGGEESLSFAAQTLDFCSNPECRNAVDYVTSNGCAEEPPSPEASCNAACFAKIAEASNTCISPGIKQLAEQLNTYCSTLACSIDDDCPSGLECACGPSRRLLFSTPPSSCYCALP
uniref:Uncharacterized protein n=1 Tax=Chrysotila carterae TaxID=13221 RepID=A0A7S4C609_CHRCT